VDEPVEEDVLHDSEEHGAAEPLREELEPDAEILAWG
jgi:hypothetical protein